MQTRSVAVVLNVVVVVTPPAVYTTEVCAPLASYVTVVVKVAAALVCVCTQVRVASLLRSDYALRLRVITHDADVKVILVAK